jgi:hypothetical protein
MMLNCVTDEAQRRWREKSSKGRWPLQVGPAIAMSAGTAETTEIGSGRQPASADPTGYRPKGGGQ